MKKVAFVVRMLQEKSFHGGGEKLFYNLIKRFSKYNTLVDIYCSVSDVEKIEGVNKIFVIDENYDHNAPLTMESFYSKVKDKLKDFDYDHVISENITPPLDITFLQGHSLANRLKNTKNELEKFLYNFRKVKKNRIEYQKKWLEQGYRKIFTVSEILKKDIVQNFGINEENVCVIYPGVDLPDNENTNFENLKDKEFTFGLIAPGFKIKGGYIFLQALAILKSKGYKFKAKIIYPKYSKNIGVKSIISLYNLHDSIEFLPYQEDISSFYRSIDCLAVPSLEDTFNLTALEAMAFKRPCIISENAGVSEIINDGINGFNFEIKGKEGAYNLSQKMRYIMDNLAEYTGMSEAAYETAKSYSWDKTFENFYEVLSKLPSKNIHPVV